MGQGDSAPETDFATAYVEVDDINAKYRLLRREATRLRQQAERPDDVKFTDNPDVLGAIRAWNDRLEGTLLVFAANDFGWPVALRPEGTPERLQENVRQELLREKYKSNAELDQVRETILESDPRIHQVLAARHGGDRIDYHLPGGWKTNTEFLTVREALGLIDYITNGHQREAILY